MQFRTNGGKCWWRWESYIEKETLKTYQLRSNAQSLSLHQKKYVNVLETKMLCPRLGELQLYAQLKTLFSTFLKMY